MGSVEDVINEEGDRFIEYLDVNKIAESKNPYQEFLRQVNKEFGTKNGLNFLGKLVDKYQSLNTLFKNPLIQKKLQKDFRGPLKKVETKEFWEKRDERIQMNLIKTETKIKEKKIKATRGRYTDREIRFIVKRKDLSLNELSYEFNKIFGQNRTKIALRDKRLRILGKKK